MGNGDGLEFFKQKHENGTLKILHQRMLQDNKFVLLIKNGAKDFDGYFWILVFEIIRYDRWCINEVTEEQATLDKFAINLNVGLNMTSNKKGMEKNVLDIQTKPIVVSFLKEDVQLLSQKSDLANSFSWMYKKDLLKSWRDFWEVTKTKQNKTKHPFTYWLYKRGLLKFLKFYLGTKKKRWTEIKL